MIPILHQLCAVPNKACRLSRFLFTLPGILFCIALALPVSSAIAQQAAIPPEVEEYSSAMQALRDSSSKQPVEPVFA